VAVKVREGVKVRLGVKLKARVGVSVKARVGTGGVSEELVVVVGVTVNKVGVLIGVKYNVTVGTGVFNPPITVAINWVGTGVPVTWS
jgi:hypothetical protein